jgi:hypothetical protein
VRDSIWLVIFASAGLPLLFLAVLTYAEYIVEEKPFWEVTVKIAWDMAVLGIGLTGGLFSDNAFLQHFTSRQAVLLTGTVIAVDFACALTVLLFKKQKKFSRTYGMLALGFGFTSVGIPCGLLIWR